jgi:triosephosphate isomerase (TIM)
LSRKPIVAGNWKMNLGAPAEAKALAEALAPELSAVDAVESVFCPPATALAAVAEAIKGSSVGLGAQNCYPKASGAFTGENSPEFLKALGCTYCIVGHSERRTIFEESDAFINEKVRFVLESGLKAILCCGETEEQREKGVTEEVVKRHITEGLKGISPQQMAKVVLAYEPVWAIGTGKTASPADAEGVHKFIRQLVADLYDEKISESVRIQYGGSVKPDNARELMSQPNIDGALVGGASLKADSFAGIVKATA